MNYDAWKTRSPEDDAEDRERRDRIQADREAREERRADEEYKLMRDEVRGR